MYTCISRDAPSTQTSAGCSRLKMTGCEVRSDHCVWAASGPSKPRCQHRALEETRTSDRFHMQISVLPIQLIKRRPFWAHGNNSLSQARYSSSSCRSRLSRNHQLSRVCGLLLAIVFSILAHPAHCKATQNARTYSASECSGLPVSGNDPSTATTLARQASRVPSHSISLQTFLRNAPLASVPALNSELNATPTMSVI